MTYFWVLGNWRTIVHGQRLSADNCPPKIQNSPPKNRKKIILRQILKLSLKFRNCPPNFEIVRQKNCPSKKLSVFNN